MRGMWTNWAGERSCVPVVFERPASTAEVAEAVRRAAEAGRTVRVAGAGHSFSDGVLTDGTLLSLERMDRVVEVEGTRVRVQAGITLHRLNQELLSRGLAFPNLGDIDVQHLGGAIATGTHGTGAERRNLSAQVVAAQVVDGSGEVHEITGGDELLALRVSVGALGVVTEVTLEVVPAFRLRGVDDREPLDEVLDSMEERLAASEHFELWTFPHSPYALTRTNTVTSDPPAGPPEWRLKAGQIWLDNRVFEGVLRTGRRFPRTVPVLNRVAGAVTGRRERVAVSFSIFASPRLFRFTETEQCIPRSQAAEALREVKALLERRAVGMPVELRFVAPDDALLSPSFERESAYIAAHVYVGVDPAPLREVEQFLQRFDARPHWGKRSWLTHEQLAPRYPRWDDFQAIRRRLDPDGRFTNGYASRMLGP
jgi:L-gulono-1,4-lactone dehydrogenase